MKTIIKIYISLALIFSPIYLINSANAATVGGWSMSNPVAQGASTAYNGAKNVLINGKDFVKKGVATITPNASQVGKVLIRGGAAYALSEAVVQIIGAGVDWVLDPENNRVKYFPNKPTDPAIGFMNPVTGDRVNLVSASQACNIYGSYQSSLSTGWKSFTFSVTGSGTSYKCNFTFDMKDGRKGVTVSLTLHPVEIKEEEETKPSYLPIDAVAEKVISNAESGDTNAQVATTAAAADIVAEAETDNVKARPIVNQLEQSSSTENADADAQAQSNTATGSQTQNPSKPDVKDLKLEFPAFCGWAPVVCEAAQTVISFPKTLTEWWNTSKNKADSWAKSISEAYTATKEWFQKDDKLDDSDTKVDVSDLKTPNIEENAISWGAYCPNDAQVPITMQGVSSTITFSWSPWCQLLSVIKPAIIASAYIGAAFIVLGLRT